MWTVGSARVESGHVGLKKVEPQTRQHGGARTTLVMPCGACLPCCMGFFSVCVCAHVYICAYVLVLHDRPVRGRGKQAPTPAREAVFSNMR